MPVLPWWKLGYQRDTEFSEAPAIFHTQSQVALQGREGRARQVVEPLKSGSALKASGLSWKYEQGGDLGSLALQQRQGWDLAGLGLRLHHVLPEFVSASAPFP